MCGLYSLPLPGPALQTPLRCLGEPPDSGHSGCLNVHPAGRGPVITASSWGARGQAAAGVLFVPGQSGACEHVLRSSSWSLHFPGNIFLSLLFGKFMYFVCVESFLLHRLFSNCGQRGLISSCGVRASQCFGFSLQSTGSRAHAQWLWYMDLVAPWHLGSLWTRD